jgi:HK97 family phage major capsid protein
MAGEKTELDLVLSELTAVKTWTQDRIDEGVAPLREELERAAASVQDVQKAADEMKRARLVKSDAWGGLRLRDGRYAGAGLFELMAIQRGAGMYRFNGDILPANHAIFADATEGLKTLADGLTFDAVDEWESNAITLKAAATGLSPHAPAMRNFARQAASWASLMRDGVRAKAMDSTTAGSGDELVPTFEAATLWMDVNLETLVLPLMTQVAMPTQPYDWPTQLGDTNWYPGSENVAATTTDVSTAKVTLTAQTLKTGVPFSDELTEDSIVGFASELRSSLARNAAEVIDDVILNADTTTANNINADGATISTADAGKAQWLLGWDGLRHLPLVDNTAMGTDHNAAVTAAAYSGALINMEKYGIARRAGEVAFITDPVTQIASLSIAELETTDSGRATTLSSGEVASLYGKPIIVSDQMRLSDDDGKVTDPASAAGNDNGTILAVNFSQWYVGFRRGITLETEREAGKGQTTMYLSFRIALQERSGTRSSAKHTAMSYNITKAVGT